MRKRKPATVPAELVAATTQLAAFIANSEKRIDALLERLRKKESECESTEKVST